MSTITSALRLPGLCRTGLTKGHICTFTEIREILVADSKSRIMSANLSRMLLQGVCEPEGRKWKVSVNR